MSRTRGTARSLQVVVLAAGLLAGTTAVAAGEPEGWRTVVRLNPEVMALDGSATLTIELSGPGEPPHQATAAFELENLLVVAGPARSKKIYEGSSGPGWQVGWVWQVRPERLGPAKVYAVRVGTPQGELRMDPATAEVRREVPREPTDPAPRPDPLSLIDQLLERPAGRATRPAPAAPEVFLRTEAEPARAYVGQAVRLTTWIYTRARLTDINTHAPTELMGAWVRAERVTPQHRELESREVDFQGKRWTTAPVDRRYLFPLQPGTLNIQPTQAQVVAQLPTFDPYYRRTVWQTQGLRLQAEPLAIEVLPLPPLPPELTGRFHGVVGAAELRVELTPTVVEAGRGALLAVMLVGEGNLEGVDAPTVTAPPGLDVMPPQSVEAPMGARRWHYVLIPRGAGIWQLPGIEEVAFNPRTAAYEPVRADIPVLHATAPPAITAVAPTPPPAASTNRARWAPVTTLAVAVPLVLLAAAGALWLRRRWGSRGSLPEELRAPFRAALAEAAREDRPRRAAAALEEAWRQLLQRAAGVPPGINSLDWPAELAAHGAPGEALVRFEALIADLHYLRHAPELAATPALTAELVERSEAIAGELLDRRGG